MFRFLGFAILSLIIIVLVPLIIQLFAAAAALFVGLALLVASCLLVFRLVRAFTSPKIEQARQRPKMRERHQEGQNRRQTQDRHQKYRRRQKADRPQNQGRHQENSRHQQKKQQWRAGQHKKANTQPGSYYEMLGVESNATRKEIEKSWRRIDFGQYLPIEFRRMCFQAYSVLINPEERRKYDAELERKRHEKEPNQYQEHRRRQEREQKRQKEYEQKCYQEQDRHRHTGQHVKPPLSGTYYERLGIEPDATRDEIVKAWRRFAIQWHPDVCNNPDATEIFKAGNEAKEALKDPARRSLYDAQLSRSERATRKENQSQYQSPSQNRQQSRHWHTSRRSQQNRHRSAEENRRQNGHRGTNQSAHDTRSRRSTHSRGRYFIGTWARIRQGPWRGSWGAWIESLYVREGDHALIRRRDGREILVVVIAVLSRSPGNRVTLCRVESI